jgi:hypothetical protein
MSVQGWRDFLAADGLDDWVVCVVGWPDGSVPPELVVPE